MVNPMRLIRPLGGVLLTSIFLALPARADDPRKAQADALFEEGVKLHDTDHDAEALEKFRKAYSIFPLPNTLMAEARSEQLTGRSVEAARHYREAMKSPLLHPKNAELAKQYLAELDSKIGKLSVTGPSGTTFSMYGETFKVPLEAPLYVDPGIIRLHGDHDGAVLEGAATVAAGKVAVLELKGPATANNKGPITATEPPSEARQSFWDAPRIAGVVAVGVGLAGIGTGIAFGGSSRSARDRADATQAQLGPSACTAGGDQAGCSGIASDRDTQHSDAKLSTVFLIVGSVVGVAGAAAFLWPRHDEVTVTPSVGKTSAGLDLSYSF